MEDKAQDPLTGMIPGRLFSFVISIAGASILQWCRATPPRAGQSATK